jgi:hypothetical protein
LEELTDRVDYELQRMGYRRNILPQTVADTHRRLSPFEKLLKLKFRAKPIADFIWHRNSDAGSSSGGGPAPGAYAWSYRVDTSDSDLNGLTEVLKDLEKDFQDTDSFNFAARNKIFGRMQLIRQNLEERTRHVRPELAEIATLDGRSSTADGGSIEWSKSPYSQGHCVEVAQVNRPGFGGGSTA